MNEHPLAHGTEDGPGKDEQKNGSWAREQAKRYRDRIAKIEHDKDLAVWYSNLDKE